MMHLPVAALLALTLAATQSATADAAANQNWVTSWFASPQPIWDTDFALPTNIPGYLHDQTVREIVRVSAGGRRVRLVLSNRYGKTALTIGEVHIALSEAGSKIIAKTDQVVTFNNQRAVTVPPGSPIVSDPLDFDLAPLQQLAITTYFPLQTALTTFHWGEQQTGYIAPGNVTNVAEIKPESQLKGRLFLSSLLVESAPATPTVVAFGDSITDGNGSTPNRNRRWPDFLAQRLAAQHVAVANAGISGARILGDRMGVNALARFEQDVLSQPGVQTVIVLMGINDIGWPGSAFAPSDKPMTAKTLIAGYQQLTASARSHNVRIIGATLPPFEGALHGTPFDGHYSPDKDRVRHEVNQWMRTAGAFDAVVDFDALLRDPSHPARLLPAYDSGDHLHPGDAGYQAMANAIDMPILFGIISPNRQDLSSSPGSTATSRQAVSR